MTSRERKPPGSDAEDTPSRGLGLLPFEISALVFLVAATGFLAINGLDMTWSSVTYSLTAALNLAPMTFAGGIFLAGAHYLVTHRRVSGYLQCVFTRAWLILWLRLWISCWVVTFAYFWLKVYVPLINLRLWDDALWNLDALTHFGIQPTVFLADLLADTVIGRILDIWYSLWILTVVLSIALFAAMTNDKLRRGVIHSCVLMWGVGSWLYLALPAWGPAFAFEGLWADLGQTTPISLSAQQLLWANYSAVLASAETGAEFQHTLGIAALPSLHVGFHFLFALWAREWSAAWFWIFLAMTALTQLSCVLTAWHYAIDGYAGMLLAYLVCRAAKRLDQGSP